MPPPSTARSPTPAPIRATNAPPWPGCAARGAAAEVDDAGDDQVPALRFDGDLATRPPGGTTHAAARGQRYRDVHLRRRLLLADMDLARRAGGRPAPRPRRRARRRGARPAPRPPCRCELAAAPPADMPAPPRAWTGPPRKTRSAATTGDRAGVAAARAVGAVRRQRAEQDDAPRGDDDRAAALSGGGAARVDRAGDVDGAVRGVQRQAPRAPPAPPPASDPETKMSPPVDVICRTASPPPAVTVPSIRTLAAAVRSA